MRISLTFRQTCKANDLLMELNAKRTEMEALKMRLQKQEQDLSKKVEKIKELELGYVLIKANCLSLNRNTCTMFKTLSSIYRRLQSLLN